MPSNASILKKLLSAKVNTRFVLLDEDGDECLSWSEEAWAKRKIVPHFLYDAGDGIDCNDLVSGMPEEVPDGLSWDHRYIYAGVVKRVNLICVGLQTIHPDSVKRVKKIQNVELRVAGINYTIFVSVWGIQIGCQNHPWSFWKTSGVDIINNHMLSTASPVYGLLTLVLANQDKIVARLKTAVKKTAVKKVVAKKAVKKTAKRR